jgi:SpoIIAA-like
MIIAEPISANALKLTPRDKLTAADFHALSPQVDAMIERSGQIRLLIDAAQFNGWDSFEAFATHAGFIRAHQGHVERLAVIAGHDWQRWLIDLARMVLHPDAKAFDKEREGEAMRWIAEP